MTYCDYCHQDIDKKVKNCDHPYLVFKSGSSKPEILNRTLKKDTGLPALATCPECGISPGGVHHFGCRYELCPKCGRQLISCHCFDNGDLWITKTPEMPPGAWYNAVKSTPENIS